MRIATNSKGELRKFHSPEKIASALGLNRRTILEMIRRKEISGYSPVANRIRIPEEELERLLIQSNLGKVFHPVVELRQRKDTKSDSTVIFSADEVKVLKQVAAVIDYLQKDSKLPTNTTIPH